MKTLKHLLLFLFFSFSTVKFTIAQSYEKQRDKVLTYNILTNGILGGIGGVINKEKNQKIIPLFLKSFAKGCLGGLVKYSAKSQLFYFRDGYNTYLAPINRAYYFLGHSMVVNASLNRGLFDVYNCNFYGLDFEFARKKQTDKKLSVKLSLASIISAGGFAMYGQKFNFYKSLEYGQFYFDANPIYSGQLCGIALHNSFAIMDEAHGPGCNHSQETIRHEMVHVYQNYDYFPISSLYKKKIARPFKDNKYFNSFFKYVKLDYEALFVRYLRLTQPKPTYWKNFYEFEAEHFATREFVPR